MPDRAEKGVLVAQGGLDYARCASLVPDAGNFADAGLNELSAQIIREETFKTKGISWSIDFDEFWRSTL